jgi:transglutaminase-like putative cysteine protease
MTSAASARRRPTRRPNPIVRGFTDAYRQLFGPSDAFMLLVALGIVLIPALTLNAVEWPVETGQVMTVAAFGVLLGFINARSRFGEITALMLTIILGLSITGLVAAREEPGGLVTIITRTIEWLRDALSGGVNQDPLVFTLLVSMLFWFLAYNTTWHMFRIDRPWRVILPPALTIVLNAIFYSGPNPLEPYLIGFMFLALVLLARSALEQREWEWFNNGVRVPRRARRQFLITGGTVAAILVLLSWIIPVNGLEDQLNRFQDFLRSDPLSELSEVWNRLFTPISADGPASADYYGGDTLELSGAIQLGDNLVFTVAVPNDRRYYWRARVFDTYELGGWSSGAEIRLTTPASPLEIRLEGDSERQPVSATFTVGARSLQLVHSIPQPLRIDLPTRTFLTYINDDEALRDVSPMNVSAIRPIQPIQRGQSYTATGLISTATADMLRAASTRYPDWIINHPQYLRTSPNVVTPLTSELAAQIVNEARAVTNYDKAKAIERWLRNNITYNETIPNPPVNVDPVEWFLFDIKEGYCNYYATAMVVMLRSQGIPARMAGGFSQGEFDPATGQFIVRERDAHTWVEAYFTGFGWIEFEPTAAEESQERGDQDQSDTSQQQSEGQPSPTPTPSPTPSPSPSPEPSATATQPLSENSPTPQTDNLPEETTLPPTATPTPSPTPSPTPTVTPIILPTAPAPVAPEPRDPLALIVPAILFVLGLMLIALLIIAVLWMIYWWWEWRGLRGLSPISRAYARLERYLALIGLRFAPEQTPEERRRRTNSTLPDAERPVTAITRLYNAERYGPQDERVTKAGPQAEVAWNDARKHILRRWRERFAFWRRRKS